MLTVNLTFDYEIFFKKNIKSIDDILFEPTERIMNLLDKYNVKATFFIDVLSYYKMKEIGNHDYCIKFKNQCIEMLKRGHNPQLHIHAHWLSSKYDCITNEWSNDYTKYKIQDYSDQELIFSIDFGIKFLNECAKEAKTEYKCNTFRAGGLILQPEEKLINALLKRGIVFDSTIAPHAFSKNQYAEYDYRKIPNKLNWFFNSKLGCCFESNDKKNSLFEIPVATVKNNVFRYLLFGKNIKIINREIKGIGFQRPYHKNAIIFNSIKRILTGYSWISVDTRYAKIIMSDLNVLAKKYECELNNYEIAIIGHPKMFSNINYDNLENLIVLLKKTSYIWLKSKF